MSDLNKADYFKELLDMTHKGYIDSKFKERGLEVPVPTSLTPLTYEDKKIQKGLEQLRAGASNAFTALNKYIQK